ncbi:MAG: ribosomal protection-like ABC-F family protein [Anaerovoracaceae bacterium]
MTVLSANNLTKVFDGTEIIFQDVSFHVNKGDRIGIVGTNGAGKSTLLNVLAGDLPADGGNYYISQDMTVGYFRQNDLFTSQKTVYEEMLSIFSHVMEMEEEMNRMAARIAELSADGGHADNETQVEKLLADYDRLTERFKEANGYGYKSEITGVLSSMAFPPSFYDKKTESLSGGERTRLALAALLLKKPDLLFLDEPTNHLDIGTLKWLEQYLRGYKGTVLIISHDRYFLDHTVNRIFEMENHRLSVYEGNYTFYAGEKRVRIAAELKAYNNQQAEIRRQEEMIRRFKERGTEKLAKRAKSREKQLEKVQRMDRPEILNDRMKIQFKENSKSGNDTLHAEGLAMSYGFGQERRTLFHNVDFDIKRGERICIIGPNGTGKTTLLKIIMNQVMPTEGFIKVGHNIQFGYYDQEQSMLSDSFTVIEEMREAYSLYSDTELRGLLGRFLFRNEDVFKPVSALSGGERARLALLKLMLSGANLLVLDEPTNHLDIASKEVFEDALMDFPGTCVIVSHDRYLLNKVPTAIYELTSEGITVYQGNYDYYNEKKAEILSGSAYMNDLHRNNSTQADLADDGSADLRQQRIDERRKNKELQAEQRRLQRRQEALEKEIETLEQDISDLEQEMYKEEYQTNHAKLTELSGALAAKKERLDQAYAEWSELS